MKGEIEIEKETKEDLEIAISTTIEKLKEIKDDKEFLYDAICENIKKCYQIFNTHIDDELKEEINKKIEIDYSSLFA